MRGVGRLPEPPEVALEHLGPGEQVVADGARLRALEVGVRRHWRLGVVVGANEDVREQPADRAAGVAARVLDVQPERRGDLVVSRPAGVDPAADRPEQPLDRRVDVLVGRQQVGRDDLRQSHAGFCQLVVVEQSRGVQPFCMDQRRLDVVRKKLGVVGAEKRPHLGREPLAHTSRPEGHVAAAIWRCRAAASSASSDAMRTKPVAAACGNVSPGAYEASVSA